MLIICKNNMPTYIYHITQIKNLKSIIKQDGLWCDTAMLRKSIKFKSIAYQTLKDERTYTLVPLDPGGHLCDYVPFYFAPRSPMLYVISKGKVEGYIEGQESVVYLVSTTETVQKSGLPFVFTDGHGIMAITEFFHDLKELKNVDWDIMKEKYWYDTDDDPDRKRRRHRLRIYSKTLIISQK